MLAHDPDRDVRTRRRTASRAHPRPLEVSPGAFDPKHFAGALASPAGLLFWKLVHETAFGSLAWRRGAWVSSEQLKSETGAPARTIRDWIAALERVPDDPKVGGPYVRVERGPRGFRIRLIRRRWYKGGVPQTTGGVGDISPGVGDFSPEVGEISPAAGEFPPCRTMEAATIAASGDPPSVDSLPQRTSPHGDVALRAPDGARDAAEPLPLEDRPGSPPPPDFWQKIREAGSGVRQGGMRDEQGAGRRRSRGVLRVTTAPPAPIVDPGRSLEADPDGSETRTGS